MKRIIFYTVFVLAVLITGAIIFKHRSININTPTATNTPAAPASVAKPERLASNAITSETNVPIDLTRVSTEQSKAFQDKFGVTSNMTPEEIKQKVAGWYLDQAQKLAEQDRHSIVFYGKTVDENNQPLADVNVHFSLNGGLVVKDLLSEANGGFYISDLEGKLLVIDVSKTGYYTSRSNRINFDYTTYQPNPIQPEIFHLRKKGLGTDLITSKYGFTPWFDVHVPIDGTPIKADLLNRSAGGNGQIEFSNIKPSREKQERASQWSFRMSIPGGGFIEENDEFPFEAPESGYQPTIEFHFKAGEPDWTDTIHRSYYIAFGQPRKYGRLDLDTQMYWGTRIIYAINPDGSQYLEPKQ